MEYNGQCYALISGGCGTNKHQQGNECVCDAGYKPSGDTCVLDQCLANQYKSGTQCIDCPAHSTSSAGSTSINQCICENGYTKSGNHCVPKTQSGKIYRMGKDTGVSTYIVDATENISINSYNFYGPADNYKNFIECNEAIIIKNGATLINNGSLPSIKFL